MKKLKNICLAVFALVLACCISNTTAAAGGFEITNVVLGEASEGSHAYIYGFDGLSVNHKVIFHQVDDYADLVLTIKNGSANLRKITDISDNNSNSFVSYTYDKHIGEELNPGDTFDFAVRIACIYDTIQDPSELTQVNAVAFNITFDETIIETPEPDAPTEPTEPTTPTEPVEPTGPTNSSTTEQASIVTDVEEPDLTIPNTGLNTINTEASSENQAGVVIAVVLIGFGFVNAAIFAFRKRPRTAVALFAISLSGIALVAPLSARAEDNIETLDFTSVIGIRKTLHIKMDAFLDGVSMPTGIDLDIPYEGILQMQQQSGMTVTPAMLVDEVILYEMPSQFEVEKIEYSNGYDDEEINPDAPLIDDLYAVVYVKTNLHQYSITYELNGGTMSASNPSSYTEMSNIVISNPTKEDYYFVGWTVPGIVETPQTDIDFYGGDIIAAGFGDLHFVANWREARIFNITYDLNGGTLSTPNPDTYKEGTPGFTLNNPAKTDWVFTGWTLADTEDQPKKDYMVSDLEDDITLVANWKQVHLRITQDSYWSPVSGEIPLDIVMTTADEIVAPAAYWKNEDDDSWIIRFDAWYSGRAWLDCEYLGPNVNCTGEHFYAGDVIKPAGYLPENDITLYAGYLAWDHPITYILGEGGHFEEGAEYPTTYNIYSELDFTAPVRDGYIFTGWKILGVVSPFMAHYHPQWTPQLIGVNRGPITLEAQWEEGGDLTTIEYLQDAKYGNCAITPLGTAVTLKDKRDEKSYRVKRLKDGKCWMVDNLALEDYTLTSEDSDIAEGTTFTLPAGDPKYYTPYYSYYTMVNILIDPVFGGYYSYNAAVAGTGYTVGARDGEDAEYSICPKGWNLPSGPTDKKGKSDYEQLFNLYSGVEAFTESADGPNMTFSGQYYHDGLLGGGVVGSYWTATTDYSKKAYSFEFSNYEWGTYRMDYSADEREEGSMVRCHLWD